MDKNDVIVGRVEALGSSGEGIIKNGDWTIFVPFALPTEKITYKVLKAKNNIAYGKLVDIIAPADERVRPKCKVFTKCGGCQFQHYRYTFQLRLKTKMVKDTLKKVGNIDFEVEPTVASDNEYYYRNKLQLPIRQTADGVKIGFFAPNSHRVVETEVCHIQANSSSKIISAIKEYIDYTKISCYSDETKIGLLKHVCVRDVGGYQFITLVLTENKLPKKDVLIKILQSKFNNFSLFVNINKLDNNVILGNEFILIYGEEFITKTELGIKYQIGVRSFMQVNDSVKRKLYRACLEISGVNEKVNVVDAYSGAGMLTALFAKKAKSAVGVEIIEEATKCADKVMSLNNITNVKNVCADCKDVLPNIINEFKNKNEESIVILDPPRQGVDESILNAILSSLPNKILYVSCNPATLSRDLSILLNTQVRKDNNLVKNENIQSKYTLERVIPFDMFANTKNVETLCLLTLN